MDIGVSFGSCFLGKDELLDWNFRNDVKFVLLFHKEVRIGRIYLDLG